MRRLTTDRARPAVRAEDWALPAANAALLKEVGQRIHPDDLRLVPWFERYQSQHHSRLAADLLQVESYSSPGAQILEYGAVPLLITAALTELGYRVSAVDLAPDRFSEAISTLNLDVRRCDVETEAVPFADGSFDLVLFNELFEHLRIDPIFTLEQVHRVLRPGGKLLLSTPNLRSFRGLRNLLFHNQAHASSADVYSQYEKLRTLGHMGHVREYTTREVSDFLQRVGFRVEEIVFRGGHGAGLTGLAERAWPRWRPFFSVVARPMVASSDQESRS